MIKLKVLNQIHYSFTHLALPLLLLPITGFSSDEWTNVKTVGGNVQECSLTSPAVSESLQPTNIKLSTTSVQGKTIVAELEVQFVNCKNGVWTPSKIVVNEFKANIKDEIGQVQSEKISFSNYRIKIRNKNGKDLQTIPIDSKDQKAKMKFKIKLDSLDFDKDDISKTRFAEIVLVADRVRQTSSDRFFDEVGWGTYRLTMAPQPKPNE